MKLNRKNSKFFMGMGYYTRSNAEYCLLATRGKVLERKSHSVSSVLCTHIEEHSKKPDVIRDLIERLVGKLPRVELFCRHPSDGWDVWGNEA